MINIAFTIWDSSLPFGYCSSSPIEFTQIIGAPVGMVGYRNSFNSDRLD